MKKTSITLVAALGLGLGGCATTYGDMQYQDGSYYAPAGQGNGDYYVAPEPDPYYYDPFYGPYGDPFWPLSYGGWGGSCGIYRFCPLWATRWYDPWSDPWYAGGIGYGGGYGYGSGFGFGLSIGDGGWYGGGRGWYYSDWSLGGHRGHGGHGRGGHDGRRPPRHGRPATPGAPTAGDEVASADPRIGTDDQSGGLWSEEDAIGGAHDRPLPRGRRWMRIAPGTPAPQAWNPPRWDQQGAPVYGGAPRSGGAGTAGGPRSGGGRSSGSSSGGRSDGGARSQRQVEARAPADDGGGRGGRRVRDASDD